MDDNCGQDWRYQLYEQVCYEGDLPPEGDGWEPFGVIGSVEHDGFRESLGGGYEYRAVVFWRRKVRPR